MKETATLEKDFFKIALWTLAGSCLVYMVGWFINVMDIDASQYASISKEMLERGDYLTFTDAGREYLDKPPLLFWVSGISMKLFGVNNVAYRVPALLATLLALYSTFRLAVLYYDKSTGYLSVIILFFLFSIYFFVIVPMNSVVSKLRSRQGEPPPTDKQCDECLSTIPVAARRCAQCAQPVK